MKVNKQECDIEFNTIMQQETSGSIAFRLEKMLYEKFHDADQLQEFVYLEEMADALASLGNLHIPPLFDRMTRGMYKDLIEKIVQEAQMAVDRQRESQWYSDRDIRMHDDLET
jgi:hypothetical protein